MPDWLPRLIVRRARTVLVVATVLLVLFAVAGVGVLERLKAGGFEEPDAESVRAREALVQQFDAPQSNLLALVTAPAGQDVDDPQVQAAGEAAVNRLRSLPGVRVLSDYWSAPPATAAGLRSRDGRHALILLELPGTEEEALERAPDVSAQITDLSGPRASLRPGGQLQGNQDVSGAVGADLARAEAIALPLTLVLLVLVFGALAAALLPLVVALIAIFGTFAVLYVATLLTDVSVFSLNLTTALAIGLGVDYALLIVSRFREELSARGPDQVAEAVTATLRTAGRTVLFSALIVAVALSALAVFPLYFLRSFAYAGMAVVALAAATSLLVLPALLMVLGSRVSAGRLLRRRSADPVAGSAAQVGESLFWARVSRVVMRRPLVTGSAVAVLLLAMGAPFLGAQFGVPDDRVLPPGSSDSRIVGDVLRSEFAGRDGAAISVVLPAGLAAPDPAAALADYARRLSLLSGAVRVDSAAGTYVQGRQEAEPVAGAGLGASDGPSVLRVVPDSEPLGSAAQELARQVRETAVPARDGELLVGGFSAELLDSKASIGGRLPLAIGLIAVSTFVLLFLFTGSVVLPLKALVINVFSLTAVLGVLTWVFQDGHGASVLGFTPGPLSMTMPLLMFCVAFGLSMDYEVFLLARIKEFHDGGADTVEAVAAGLARTGRIVTAAAALLAITFFAFLSSEVSFLQMFGLGTGLAIVLDATLVRGVLVPAVMRLMGAANWWAPAPLRRLHQRIGLREHPDELVQPRASTVSVGSAGPS